MNRTQDLIPFLSATLERLVIYSEGSYPPNLPEPGADTAWLTHLATACKALKEVYFDFEPATSHDTLVKFFQETQRLTELTLSDSINNILSNTLMKIFFNLPKLDVLELNYPITLAMATQIKGALPLLPSIRELTLSFSEGAGIAPSVLLEGLHTLQHLEITLGNSTSNWHYDINTSVFRTCAQLESLQVLVVWVHLGLHITDAEVAALTNLESLRSLEIFQLPDTANSEEDGPDALWRSALQTTAELLTKMLLALKNLEWLQVELACEPVHTTYEDAALLQHLMSRLRHCHISNFVILSQEAQFATWPTEEDWEFAPPPGAWLPTNKSYHPDTQIWEYRDLNPGMAKRIEVMDEEGDFGDDISDSEHSSDDGDNEEGHDIAP